MRKNSNGRLFAMKVIPKDILRTDKQVEHILTERHILKHVKCKFLVALDASFQTKSNLYFIMEWIPGGELFYHLEKEKKFSEARTKLYIAEILLALEYLHSNSIIYRYAPSDICFCWIIWYSNPINLLLQ